MTADGPDPSDERCPHCGAGAFVHRLEASDEVYCPRCGYEDKRLLERPRRLKAPGPRPPPKGDMRPLKRGPGRVPKTGFRGR